MEALVRVILMFISFELFPVSSQNLQKQCPLSVPQRFKINPDSSGAERCSLWPPPVKILPRTEHHGECLEACALTPECSSYNYFYDTTRCELICHPVHFGVVPNCINYLVSSNLTFATESISVLYAYARLMTTKITAIKTRVTEIKFTEFSCSSLTNDCIERCF